MNRINLLFTLLILSSCTVGKDYESPNIGKYTNEKLFNKQEAKRFKAAEPVSKWWNQLGDKQLSGLIEDALKHNNDIKIAAANLAEARAFVNEIEFDLFPQIGAKTSVIKEKFSNDGLFPGGKQTLYNAGLDTSWELDLFGRVRSNIKATNANAKARESDLTNAYITIAAEVARSYILLRGAQYRLDVANKNSANQQKTYDLISVLKEAGRSDALDTERANTQLELTRSTIPLLEAEVNSAINRISVLTGNTPSKLKDSLAKTRPLPSIPESINIGDVESLLKRRPDVASVERRLAAATAEYNVNVADFYPRISLLGGLGFLSTSFGNLGAAGTSTFLFGPDISWSALKYKGVRARVNAADARSKARLAEFEKTVLTALEEIDNSMVNFSNQERSRENLFNAANSSAKAAEYADERFEAGIDSFLDVLDAQRTKLEAQDRLAQSETKLALDLISIYKALGGGWNLTKPATVENLYQ